MSLRTQIIGTAARVLEANSHVTINEHKLKDVAHLIESARLPDWNSYLPPTLRASSDSLEVAYYFFVFNSVQFSFWTDTNGVVGRWRDGARSLADIVIAMFEDGVFPGKHLRPSQVKEVLAPLFQGIPMAEARLEALVDAARRDDFLNLLAPARSAGESWTLRAELAHELAEAFPSFQDPFLKRAQLCLGMLGTRLLSQGQRVNLDLTVYADYRVPQVLRHMGVFVYDAALAQAVDKQVVLPEGGAMEQSLRAATLIVGAKLAEISGAPDALVDAALFLQSRESHFKAQAAPFHLVRTTRY